MDRRSNGLRAVIVAAALAAASLAFIATISIGLFLAGIGESGARGSGLLLAIGSVAAFLATLALVFAPQRRFRGSGKALAALATLLALAPVVTISGAALFFSGNPLGSSLPVVDWTAFAIGILLALGAAAIALLGLSRLADAGQSDPSDQQTLKRESSTFHSEPSAAGLNADR